MSRRDELLASARTRVEEVDGASVAALIDEGAVVLDVREADETSQGVIAGSVTVPRGSLELVVEDRLADKTVPVVVVCASGTRSVLAAATLIDLGYDRPVSLVGGFNRWKDEGRPWVAETGLSGPQRNRYSRHLMLPEVGVEGQRALLESKVLILGAGGLGSPAALYLAAAGVGTIGVVDMDVVDESNLQRQVLHNSLRLGWPKVDSARQTLTALNPDVKVETHPVRLDASNVVDLIDGYDVIVDGVDNFPTRYLVNDASVKTGIPVVHGSIFRFEGQVTVFDPKRGPTYRDLLPAPPPPELAPNCAEAGVLGVLPGIVGSLQALEAIKLIVGIGKPLIGRLLLFDALEVEFREFRMEADPANQVTWERRGEITITAQD